MPALRFNPALCSTLCMGTFDARRKIGGYEAAEEAADAIQQCYVDLGRVIGAAPRNVAVVENATVAVAQALSASISSPAIGS